MAMVPLDRLCRCPMISPLTNERNWKKPGVSGVLATKDHEKQKSKRLRSSISLSVCLPLPLPPPLSLSRDERSQKTLVSFVTFQRRFTKSKLRLLCNHLSRDVHLSW